MGRVGEEVEDGGVDFAVSVGQVEIGGVVSLGDGVVPVEHAEVVAGEEEEDGEGNPEDDGASSGDAKAAGVDRAVRTRAECGSTRILGGSVSLKLAVARLLGGFAVRLLVTVSLGVTTPPM